MQYAETVTFVSEVGFLLNFCKVNNSLPNCEGIMHADIFSLLPTLRDKVKSETTSFVARVKLYLQRQQTRKSLCLVDRASFITTLFLFQLDTLLFFFLHLQFFSYNFSLYVSDRLVHQQENQITRAASGTFPCNMSFGL